MLLKAYLILSILIFWDFLFYFKVNFIYLKSYLLLRSRRYSITARLSYPNKLSIFSFIDCIFDFISSIEFAFYSLRSFNAFTSYF